jgi:hypothetical protein
MRRIFAAVFAAGLILTGLSAIKPAEAKSSISRASKTMEPAPAQVTDVSARRRRTHVYRPYYRPYRFYRSYPSYYRPYYRPYAAPYYGEYYPYRYYGYGPRYYGAGPGFYGRGVGFSFGW